MTLTPTLTLTLSMTSPGAVYNLQWPLRTKSPASLTSTSRGVYHIRTTSILSEHISPRNSRRKRTGPWRARVQSRLRNLRHWPPLPLLPGDTREKKGVTLHRRLRISTLSERLWRVQRRSQWEEFSEEEALMKARCEDLGRLGSKKD